MTLCKNYDKFKFCKDCYITKIEKIPEFIDEYKRFMPNCTDSSCASYFHYQSVIAHPINEERLMNIIGMIENRELSDNEIKECLEDIYYSKRKV